MTALCPICRRPIQHRSRPFCSPRCAEVDLGRWLLGAYALPGDPLDDESDSPDVPAAVATRGRVDPA